jgi:hypothetical protein
MPKDRGACRRKFLGPKGQSHGGPGQRPGGLIDDYPAAGKTAVTNFVVAHYQGSAGGQYKSLEKYLTPLADTSKNLT